MNPSIDNNSSETLANVAASNAVSSVCLAIATLWRYTSTSPINLFPVAYDLVYKEKDTRDERSAKVLDILLDSTYIDFASLYDFGGVNGVLVNVLYKDQPLASNIEKIQSKIDTSIAKLVEAWMPIE